MARDNSSSVDNTTYLPLVTVSRGETVESVHHGAIAVVDSEDRVIASIGDLTRPAYLRSAGKPAQLLPLLRSGAAERFGFTEAEIAIMVGSHGGEPFHVETVRSILGKIGLDESALRCGLHMPFHAASAAALRAAGVPPSVLHNNCSGKHAGMLAQSVHLGAPTEGYLEESHPCQIRIRAVIEELTGCHPGPARTALDGCSAPTFAVPLRAAALMYARLLAPGEAGRSPVAEAARVVGAMRGHPEMVAGTDRLCTALMRRCGSGLIAKVGAEGFYGLGFVRDGRGVGIALKIAGGEERQARPSVALEVLRQLGVIEPHTLEELRARFVSEPHDHHERVIGSVTPVFDLGAVQTARPVA